MLDSRLTTAFLFCVLSLRFIHMSIILEQTANYVIVIEDDGDYWMHCCDGFSEPVELGPLSSDWDLDPDHDFTLAVYRRLSSIVFFISSRCLLLSSLATVVSCTTSFGQISALGSALSCRIHHQTCLLLYGVLLITNVGLILT